MNRICVVFFLVAFQLLTASAQDFYTQGVTFLKARDTAAAITAFQNSRQSGRERGLANYWLAAIAYNQGKIDEAATYGEASLQADDEDAKAQQLFGDILIAKGDVAGSLKSYRRAAKLAPNDANVSAKLGEALVRIDSADAAIVHLTRAKIAMPKNVSVLSSLGDAYAKMGVQTLAVQNYKDAIAQSPKNIALHMKLAGLYLNNRQYNDAVKVFDAVERIDSTFGRAHLEEGRLYFRAKLYVKAVEPLRKYLRLNPKSVEAESLFVRALYNAGKYAQAAKSASALLKRDSTSAEVWRVYAYSLGETKEYKNAVNAFAGLERHTALVAEDHRKLGKLLFRLKREDDAIKVYEAAFAADSSNCEPYNDLGFLYMKKREYARAAEMYEKRISCEPGAISAYLNAGASYMALVGKGNEREGLLAHARDVLVRAKRLDSDHPLIRFRLAQYYSLVDSLDLAKQEYEAIIKTASAQPARYRKELGEAYMQLATHYSFKKQPAIAVQHFGKALASGYESDVMQLNWGLAILQTIGHTDAVTESRRKNSDAVQHFRRAIALNMQNAQAHLWLAEGLIRARVEGQYESIKQLTQEACREYKKVLKLDPNNETAKKQIVRYGCK